MFRPRTAPDAIDLISHLLEYTPSARLTSVQAMAHSFFDELRAPDAQMPNGKPMPPLFDFTIEGASARSVTWLTARAECSAAGHELLRRLVPAHAEAGMSARGIDIANFTPLTPDQMRVSLD